MAELKPFEVIMKIDFGANDGVIAVAHAEKVAELVRCKDCKHCFVDGTNVRYNVCELNHNKVQSNNWFCADGERKTDNT